MSLKLQFYNERCADLAKSMMLKSDILAIETESKLDPTLEFLNRPRVEWKYYLNCGGEYHPVNEMMTVTSLDTRATIDFTKDVLKDHPLTLQLYGTFGIEYQQLLNRFPTQAALIHGIIYGRTPEEVVNMTDYFIIGYNRNLVEAQEYNLIPELNSRLNALAQLMGNTDYTLLEKGFATVHMLFVCLHLTNQIKFIRYRNIHTSKAHSFYVWEKINSKVPLEDLKRYLTTEEVMYLYKNIDRLHAGRGSNKVFDEIIDKFILSRKLKPYRLTIELDKKGMHDIESSRDYLFAENPLRDGETRLQSKTVYVDEHIRRSRYKDNDYPELLAERLKYKNDINSTAEIRIVSEESSEAELRNLLTNVDFNFQFMGDNLVQDIFNLPNHITGDIYMLSFREALTLYIRLIQITEGTTTEFIPYFYTHQVSTKGVRPTETSLVNDWGIPPHLAKIMVGLVPTYPSGEPTRQMLNKFIDDFSHGILAFRRLLVQSTTRYNEMYIDRLLGEYLQQVKVTLIGDNNVNYNDWLESKGIVLSTMSEHDLLILRDRILTDIMQISLGVENEMVSVMSDLLSRFIAYRTNLSRESIPSSSLNYSAFIPFMRGVRTEMQTIKHSIGMHLEIGNIAYGSTQTKLGTDVVKFTGIHSSPQTLKSKNFYSGLKPIVQSPMTSRTTVTLIK